ncbi:MAG: ATP-binding protein [Desulfomicrobium sp.]
MFSRIRNTFFADETRTLLQWQERTFTVVFFFICVLAVPVLARSLIQAVSDGLYSNLFLYSLCYLFALCITFSRFIPFRVRALAGVAILFAAGMIAILTVGPLGSGRIFLFASGIFATVVLGIGYGLGVFVLQVVVLFFYSHLLRTDFAGWSNIELFTPSSWVTSSSTFIFLSLLFVVAMGRMIGGLSRTFARLREANLELRRSRNRFETIVGNANDIIFELDPQSLGFTYASSAFKSLLGYGAEEIVGTRFADYVHEDDAAKVGQLLRQAVDQGSPHDEVEYRFRHRDGSWRWLVTKGGALADAEGRVESFAGISRDVTERREMEERLRRAKEEADAATRTKSAFLANMSHEVRTPLNGVMGMIQLLQLTGLDEEQTEYADTALESCRRLVRLLTDILDISRVEANMLSIRSAPMDMREILSQTRALFMPLATESGLEFSVTLDDSVPDGLVGDAVRLQQILSNLVGNALKFTPTGSVSLEACRLSGLRPGRCRMFFSVRDTGIGIPDDKLAALFRPFSQVSEGYTRSYQGAGLGLSICKGLIDLMGGGIAVISEVGAGTEIAFSLEFDTRDLAGGGASGRSWLRPDSLEGMRLLLVEDDAFSMALAEKLLQRRGAVIETAADGRLAIEALKQGGFDLVLMDIQMPDMDGIEATRAIRQGLAGDGARGVPIIAMTAYAMVGDKDRFLEAGMDGYLSKPFEIGDLLGTIAAVMKKRGRPADCR